MVQKRPWANGRSLEIANTTVLGWFAATEGISNVIPLSDYRYTSDFAEKYGVLMTDGPLAGLLARSVVVVDPEGKVVYTELVPEITQEPDYEAALKAVK